MRDLDRANERLMTEGLSCVLCRGDRVLTSSQTGIRPLMGWLDGGMDLSGFSAADKIVGKAAALLFSLMGVTAVYGTVMSRAGLDTLNRLGLEASCGSLVPGIVNRTGDGPCPMEAAVMELEDPVLAREALRNKLAALAAAAREARR